MPLNYYAIGRVLGGKMVSGKTARFGNFERVAVEADVKRHYPRTEKEVALTMEQEKELVAAFEHVRKGHAPDRLLWDTQFAESFHRAARDRGLDAPGKTLTRRLINIRKNSSRYKKHGIEISDSTVVDPHPSIAPRYAHAVEFALVRLRYLYGASIDEILLDPSLGTEYVAMACRMAPNLKEEDLRLGALYIRKSRFLKKGERTLFDNLDVSVIDEALTFLGCFKDLHLNNIPEDQGLIVVGEQSRLLYVGRNDNLQASAREMVQGPAIPAMRNHFWRPDPSRLNMRVFQGSSLKEVSLQRWQLKLIADKKPVFNWPVHNAA